MKPDHAKIAVAAADAAASAVIAAAADMEAIAVAAILDVALNRGGNQSSHTGSAGLRRRSFQSCKS
jgi:hypothetical protein